MQNTGVKAGRRNWLHKQRAKRIAAEIQLLERMDWRLWKLGLVCFWGALAAVILAVFAVVEMFGGPIDGTAISHFAILMICAASVSFLFWFWRYPIWGIALLGYLVLILLVAVLFEDSSVLNSLNVDWPSDSGRTSLPDRKELLRWRVQRAIEKRQKILNKLKT
jgi:hypothetical protein